MAGNQTDPYADEIAAAKKAAEKKAYDDMSWSDWAGDVVGNAVNTAKAILPAALGGEGRVGATDIARGAYEGAKDAVTFPGDVMMGKQALYDEYGNPLEQAVGRSYNAAATLGGASSVVPRPTNSLGVFGGLRSQTADKFAAREAMKMEASGASPNDIWDQTGWFRGADNEWRYEIPDQGTTVNSGGLRILLGSPTFNLHGRLGDYLQHPKLFAAYPDFADMSVATFDRGNPNHLGTYYPRYDAGLSGIIAPRIEFHNNLLTSGANQRSTILHEIQHAIQQKQGFAPGTNINAQSITQRLDPAYERYTNAVQNDPDMRELMSVRSSMEYKDQVAKSNKLFKDEYAEKLNEIDNSSMPEAEKEAAYNALSDQYNAKSNALFPLLKYVENLGHSVNSRNIPLYKPNQYLTPEQAYRNFAGEVEARNVQNRMNFNDASRKGIRPWDTQEKQFIDQLLPENDVTWRFGYDEGGEVDEDIHNALRIARAGGGRAEYATDGSVDPQVFMTDAQGRQYDIQGKPIQPATTQENSNSSAQSQPENINKMFNAAPQNYYSDVQPLIDYATTPIDRPGMASEPDLVDVMRVASQVAAEGQPQPDARGEGNLARRREEYINSLYGADKQGASSAAQNAAWIANRAVDVSPWAVGEVLHDIPYDAGTTGDYQTAAAEGGLNALFTAPGMSAVGAVARPIVKAVRAAPKVAAGLAGVGAATLGSDEAEAGPARWFSKAMEVAGALPMEKMTGQQALAMLKKAVSPEELRWTGTEKFLNSRPQVSKGELLEHLKNNRMQVNEIRLGGEKPKTINYLDEVDQDILDKYEPQFKAAEAAHKEALEKFYPTLGGQDEETAWNAVKEAKRAENDLKLAAMQEMRDRLGTYRPTKYEDYSTPGGEGYTETLYALGGNKKPKVEQRNRMFYLVDENGNTLRNQSGGEYSYYTESDANRAAASIHRESGRYKSSHWDDPDVLAHSRSQTLVYDPPGANRPYRVHNVDETQSDWGQAARKKGIYDHEARQKWEFDLNTTQNDLRKTTQAIRDRALELELTTDLGQAPRTATQAEYNAYHTHRQNLIDNDPEILALREKANNLTNRRNLLEESAPPASGVPSAPYVGSTEGWTDLAIKKQLDKALDSNADYFSWSPGEVHAERYDLRKHIGALRYNPATGALSADSPSGKRVFDEIVDEDNLDNYVGKEMADKIRNQSNALPVDEDTLQKRGTIKLEGLDLKTGGEGMIGYYDKVYLKRVQDVIKKATGEKPVIEEIEVQTADGPRKQLGIRLTDEMREKARFSDFNRGGVVQKALALTSKM